MKQNDYDKITKYINDEGLDKDIRLLISDFAILWNRYEEKLYDNHHHIGIIRKTIRRTIADWIEVYSNQIDELYLELYEYVRSKTTFDYDGIARFFNINTAKKDSEGKIIYKDGEEAHYNDISKKDLERLIRGKSSLNKLNFLLVISAKVRNNLYHGSKDPGHLKDQKNLFRICNSSLFLVLEMKDRKERLKGCSISINGVEKSIKDLYV